MVDKKRIDAIRGLMPLLEDQRYKYNITDLKEGGYFTFQGQNWLVKKISRYLDVKWDNFAPRKSEEWTNELQIYSLKTGKTRFIEFAVDDGEIDISLTETEIKLKDLGISRTDLAEISDEEEGTVSFKGKSFHYSEDETWAALYYPNDNAVGVPVRFFEFEADDDTCLTVEAWHDDVGDDRPDREAFISVPVSLSEITVLQLSN